MSCPEYLCNLSEAILAEWPVLLICQRKSPDQFLWHESDLALISTDHPIFERRSANPAGGRGLVAGLRGKSEIPMNYENLENCFISETHLWINPRGKFDGATPHPQETSQNL